MPENMYSDIISMLMDRNVFHELFDIFRIVEAKTGKLIELKDGVLHKTDIPCNNVFGSDQRCRNCTSIRAYYTNETIAKIEYSNGSILLIMSIPIQIDTNRIVVELVKDITRSLTVDVKDSTFSGEIPAIIDKLNKISTTDALSGLQNRRYLDDRLPLALANCQTINTPVSLVMIDIDHFKKVNDTYGHQHGDIIITGIAKILLSYIRRNSDFAVRYGGEEMLLCFPGVSHDVCLAICNRIQEQLQSVSFTHDGQSVNVTVSMGIAESQMDNAYDKDTLIATADKRLYRAKNMGRNRIVGND